MIEFIKKNKKVIIWTLVIIYACVLFGMQFVRMFDNNFWGDEAYSIIIVRKKWLKMVKVTAADVHPPLYYSILMIGERLLPGVSWMYHFVTVLGYGIILVMGLTFIRKQLGNITALIFITMASVLDCTLYLNLEVRMYTWAGFFVIMSYYFFKEIMTKGAIKDYVWFVAFSLMAAYTHYYALVSVAFFYVMLLIWCLCKKDKVRIKRTLICYLVTVLAYLPWFIILIMTFLRTLEDYWMVYIPTVTGSLRFLFELTGAGFDLSKELEVFFGATVIYAIVYCVRRKEWDELFWMLTGCLSVGGTIMTGEFISHVFRPMYLERYLYPVALISWIILGTNISKIRGSKIITAVLICLLLGIGIPSYIETYTYEMAENEIVEDFYAKIQVSEDQHIYSDELELTQAVLGYYYPKTGSTYITLDDLPELDPNGDYWLFLNHTKVEEYMDWLEQYGFTVEERYMNGVLGSQRADAYKIVKIQ